MDEVEQVAQYAEQALANDAWWYRLGYATGYAQAQQDAE